MQKNRRLITQRLAFAAMCAALSLVLGKLLQIPIGDSVRVSFESLPVLFASLVLGPVWGGGVGLTADLVGCAVMGYAVNPIITLGMVCVGVLPAVLLLKKERFFSVFLPIFCTHAVANMCIKSFGLWLYFGTPLPIILLRIAVSAVLSVVESVILYELFTSFSHFELWRTRLKRERYQKALSYIHKTDWKGSRLGLERIRTLCGLLGNPQKDLRFIHVAGTNGKGSVSAMLTSVLCEAGLRVGTFTSPFLVEFRERISINRTPISEQELVEAVSAVRPFADSMEDAPTEFELMTALAFWHFRKKRCDVVVCEVGLGGEFDSTNVIDTPLLALITSIALDHTRELGATLTEIAAAKAGIIKPGGEVLFAEPQNQEALAVLSARATALGARFHTVDFSSLSVQSLSLVGTRFSFGAYRQLSLSLVGAYQPANAATVLSAVDLLRQAGLSIGEDAVVRGLARTVWPGRFEVLRKDGPVVIFDGAHNPHGAAALRESMQALFGEEQQVIALSAVMADKDYAGLFSRLSDCLSQVYCVSPAGHVRALEAKKLAAFCGELGLQAVSCPSVSEGVRAALSAARKTNRPLFIFGSLYLYEEARRAVEAYSESETSSALASAKE